MFRTFRSAHSGRIMMVDETSYRVTFTKIECSKEEGERRLERFFRALAAYTDRQEEKAEPANAGRPRKKRLSTRSRDDCT